MVRRLLQVVKSGEDILQCSQEDDDMKICLSLNWRIIFAGLAVAVAFSMAGCVHRNPRTNEDRIRYGVRLAEKGYWTEAGMQWRIVLNEDPDNVAALNNLGIAAEVLEGVETATRFIEKAYRLRPDDKHIESNLNSLQKRTVEQKNGGDEPDEQPK